MDLQNDVLYFSHCLLHSLKLLFDIFRQFYVLIFKINCLQLQLEKLEKLLISYYLFDNMFSLVRSAVRLGAVANSAKYSARLYHDLVIDHYEHPRNVGRRPIRILIIS